MKRATRMAVAVVVGLAMPAVAFAQEPGHDHHDGPRAALWGGGQGMPLQALLRHQAELELSAEQIARLEGIQTRLQEQNQPLLAQLRELGLAMRGNGDATPRAGARGPLTPEQREEMRARMEERRAQMTPEQREEMRARMEERRSQARPERGERMRVRMHAGVPEEARPVVEQLRQNTSAALTDARAVLTAEQQAQIQELMRGHAGERGRMLFRRDQRGPAR